MPYDERFRKECDLADVLRARREEIIRQGKKLVFEGPGQDPFIVFAGADLDLALEDLIAAKFMYSGQTCTAPKRVFVQRAICGEFLDRLEEKAASLAVGEPEDERTDVSLVASSLAVARRITNTACAPPSSEEAKRRKRRGNSSVESTATPCLPTRSGSSAPWR